MLPQTHFWMPLPVIGTDLGFRLRRSISALCVSLSIPFYVLPTWTQNILAGVGLLAEQVGSKYSKLNRHSHMAIEEAEFLHMMECCIRFGHPRPDTIPLCGQYTAQLVTGVRDKKVMYEMIKSQGKDLNDFWSWTSRARYAHIIRVLTLL